MANAPFKTLADDLNTTDFRNRCAVAMAASALSVRQNVASSDTRKSLAMKIIDGDQHIHDIWPIAIRVLGTNITKITLTDDEITAQVETLFNIYAGT